MSLDEMVKLVDELVFDNTGKHLDNLQKMIIEKTLEDKNYHKIAEEVNCSDSHVRNVDSEIWQVLSEALGKTITKRNFKHIFSNSRLYNSFSSAVIRDYAVVNNNIGYCREKDGAKAQQHSRDSPISNENLSTNSLQFFLDLTQAPQIFLFNTSTGRDAELFILKQWIVEENNHLITVYGLSEIGKSTLIRQLIEQIKEHFDYIIWRNLNKDFTLKILSDDLKQVFLSSQNCSFSSLLDYFNHYKCLVILDDFQNIYQKQKLASEYLPECEDYRNFFKQLVNSSHQSCLMVISDEKPREANIFNSKIYPVRSLELKGLGKKLHKFYKQMS